MKQLTSMAEANRYLSRFYQNTRAKYALDNMRQLMEYLGNPQDRFKTVHIAGTSGKSSTAYYMSALLAAGGAKVGLTVSPHVDSLTERVQINGQPLGEKEFCRELSVFLELVEQTSIKPSWFEVVVGFAYWYFAKQAVDYVVAEVGLGGLLDATNVITRPDKLCMITDIGLDHTEILGHQLTDIAAQKIGIVQEHNQVLSQPQPAQVIEVFEKECRKKGAVLEVTSAETETAHDMPAYQVHNWQLAYAAYQTLEKRGNLSHLTDRIFNKTKHIVIPGRMDIRVYDGKTLIMDGAHNAQKMKALLDSLHQLYPDTGLAVLLALKAGKEYQDIVPLLAPVANRLIITSFETNQDTPIQSMDPGQLAKAFEQAGKSSEVVPDSAKAYQELLSSDEKLLLVTGSFYLLSQIRNN